uniref:Uncharacterized protein n=1 Tax=Hyaloperonospora arabidopsidis (strain Emoy2) TaxID=559515 RepID=M4C495_HYAAE
MDNGKSRAPRAPRYRTQHSGRPAADATATSAQPSRAEQVFGPKQTTGSGNQQAGKGAKSTKPAAPTKTRAPLTAAQKRADALKELDQLVRGHENTTETVMATDSSGNASSSTPQTRNTARDIAFAEVDHAHHVVDRLILAAANVQKKSLKKKAEYFKSHARELKFALAQKPTPTSAAPIIDVDASVLPLLGYKYRMAKVEAIRVSEEATSANLVLKAKVRKLDRPPHQVTPDLALNTPHEQLQFEIPPAIKAGHIPARSRATIQRLLHTFDIDESV